MLSLSLKCRAVPGCHMSEARRVVFSNARIWQRIEGADFALVPSGAIGSAWAYTLKARVFSPPPEPGTLITPHEVVLDDIASLLGYVLDVELGQDVDGCRALAGKVLSAELNRLVPSRFDPDREILAPEITAATAVVEGLMSAPEAHLLVIQRVAKAYERAMLALARGQRDLAYVLLVFALECLAQTRPSPERIDWEDYPPRQRAALDRILEGDRVPEETACKIRESLTEARHLRVTERFREFVLDMLRPDFFLAAHRPDGRHAARLRRSLMPRLLDQAYEVRSGFAHALAPVAEAVVSHALDDFCRVPLGDLAFTFRGLHRVLREVMSVAIAKRSTPDEPVRPPDVPGVIRAHLSFEYWMYRHKPRADGRDARYWLATLLSLHVRFCVRKSGTPPPQPIPVAAIGDHAAACSPEKRHRPAMLALAWICGHAPRQQVRITIETLVAQFIVEGICGSDVEAAAKVFTRHLATGTPGLDLPVAVEIALAIRLAQGFLEMGKVEECRRWLEIARDDAVDDAPLQKRLADAASAPEQLAISATDLLFPRSTPGRLLEGFASEAEARDA